MKALWGWIVALVTISLATLLAPNIVFSIFTFPDGISGLTQGHDVLGRVLLVLTLVWLLVFAGMCVRYKWKALWCLPLTSLLYIALQSWGFWICC
jgi:hypothetical protein